MKIKNKKIEESEHYKDVPLKTNDKSNSILETCQDGLLSKDEKIKLFDYIVLHPINLEEKSRGAYVLKKEKDIDFSNKHLKEKILNIYNFDDVEKFHMLSANDKDNYIEKWFINGERPNNDCISLERICIKNTYGNSKIKGLFWFVRNCVCHCNFDVIAIGKNKYIILEDNTSKIIRGRGIIELKKLFKIVEAIKEFE